ncbi:MAG: Fic family protein [Candidatus Dormibacteria bacterium]
MTESIPADTAEAIDWEAPEPMIAVPELTGGVVSRLTRLAEFKGRFSKLADVGPEELRQLRRVATIESVGSSTRIEGALVDDDEVAQILGGISIDSFRARDEGEVKGYGELLNQIFEAYEHMELTENHVRQLHSILLKHSQKDERHRGNYKVLPNHVEARLEDGSTRVVFRTASPFDTIEWMPRLLDETRAALQDQSKPDLVVIADFVLWFLAIHPFQDGNGRLSRALTTMLLLKQGYSYVPYASFEKVVEDNKAGYYEALRQAQRTAPVEATAYGPWLDFMLHAWVAQTENLESRISHVRRTSALPEKQKQLCDLIAFQGVTSTERLAHELEWPERTIRYHLEKLVAQGAVEPVGGGTRGRRYRLPVTARVGLKELDNLLQDPKGHGRSEDEHSL